MVEKGVPIPPELIAPKPRPADDLRRGLTLLVGLGYLTAFKLIKSEPAAPSLPTAIE